jgi:hypothetical protein
MEPLNIKIAIIQRLWDNSPGNIQSITGLAFALLGVEISFEIVQYVCLTTQKEIVRNLGTGNPLAVKLNKLAPKWDFGYPAKPNA